MSKTNKDMTNAGLAGVALGAAVGVATTVLFSDKKRRDKIMQQAGKLKNDFVDNTLKFKKEQIAQLEDATKDLTKEKVTKVAEKVISEKLN